MSDSEAGPSTQVGGQSRQGQIQTRNQTSDPDMDVSGADGRMGPDSRSTVTSNVEGDHVRSEEADGLPSTSQSTDGKNVTSMPTMHTASTLHAIPPKGEMKALPPIRKRRLPRTPKGILKPAPPPSKAFSFRRDVLQQLNSRLAQQGVNVQVPVPPAGGAFGALSETAQGAGNILGGMFKRVSGLATGATSSAGQEQGQPRSSLDQQDHRRDRQVSSQAQSVSSTAGAKIDRIPPETSTGTTNNLPQPSASVRPLRRVRFSPANMSVVYPISGSIAPGEEDATRLRIEEEHRKRIRDRQEKQWTLFELESLYRECCRMREEHPLKKMRSIFQSADQLSPPRLATIDLSFVPLDRQAIEPISDLLSTDFGLQKLVLENCGLSDEGIKSILHALLVSGTLPNLSLASNKRIKYHGWRYVGIFMRRAKALKYLDLSENSINRASLEHIAGALGSCRRDTVKTANEAQKANDSIEDQELTIPATLLLEKTDNVSSLTSLRLENCGLKTSSLELLSQNVCGSKLCHLSLRRNRISQMGAVALAVMLKDIPDQLSSTADQATMPPDASWTAQAPYAVRTSPRPGDVEFGAARDGSPTPRRNYHSIIEAESPRIVSSPAGGVTRRTLPQTALESLHDASESPMLGNGRSTDSSSLPRLASDAQAPSDGRDEQEVATSRSHRDETAFALAEAKRAKRILSSIPRTGTLLTLDLKSNDIRSGVVYLSQALKKNRTLKVLNLSDNGIEVPGLVALADALKYNATLETLDVSHNPCCGPGLEGITTLRTAFALDSHLKRLFLSDTDLSSEGAIALAEFLPEAKSLIHLDLTENLQIDIAGVMALAVSVKMNKSIRCLDLNIPPNAPDFARLSQEILRSCVRNTEYAQRRAQQRGLKAPISAPIYKSSLARAAKEKEERARLHEATRQLEVEGAQVDVSSPESQLRSHELKQAAVIRVIEAAEECLTVMRELMAREKEQEKEALRERAAPRRPDGTVERQISEFAQDLMTQSRQLRGKLRHLLGSMDEGENLERALQVNDGLETISASLTNFFRGQTDVGDVKTETERISAEARTPTREALNYPSTARLEVPSDLVHDGLSSPNFSIGSDESSEDDENDNVSLGGRQIDLRQSKRRGKSAITTGLGIGNVASDEPETKAAREIPLEPQTDSNEKIGEDALVNTKAKGQLSEEAEIFRRAKSLSIADDKDSEEEESDAPAMSLHEAGDASNGSTTSAIASKSLNGGVQESGASRSGNGTSPKMQPSASVGQLTPTLDDRSDVSGEELRKELLETQVPRKISGGSSAAAINPTTAAESQAQLANGHSLSDTS